ncbi:zinc finger protein 37-like isoform X2 [Xyrauchen texanus]|uniref:zinc finger protein 37-like isoform X2 n=1 Tax=Xyrauchen texanus TaxID=154827 RepID=UPI00224283D2|nr:zinc finger protein 37-like isoform X2 [Xyrauchen texanus]
MNGDLYISFFQGQLESALEQVVQLAVQEITKTAGATLNSMLLETATKEQENQRLRATIQSQELEHGGKRKINASKRRKDSNDGTKQHTPSQSTECRVQSQTFRREQKGRAVGQLKAVMEHVLEFAVCELTKIVEDNFDDLLVEFTKKERENHILKEQLQHKNLVEDNEVADAETEDCENDSDSPSSSKVKRQESQGVPDLSPKIAWEKEQMETTNEADKQTVIAVAQDWVPILDKVFGQKWCSDLFQIKEVTTSKEECSGLGSGSMSDMDSLIRETLMPSCLASQRKLELEMGQLPWLQAKDLEVVSLSSDTKGDDSNIRSPSMLQRLLTLPYQLLEDDEESMDAVPSLEVSLDPSDSQVSKGSKGDQISTNMKKEEDEDEGDETRTHELDRQESLKHKSRRKSHACKNCGRKFSRVHLLRAHQLTHETPNRCQECGKIFSQSSKLQAHLRMHTGKTI